MGLYEDLEARGLVAQVTSPELRKLMNSGGMTVYLGFDPTADTLHVGSLLGLVTLKRIQKAGHRVIALVGGATGFIGDPSFKSQERQLLTAAQIEHNAKGIGAVISRFVTLDGSKSLLVNNLDWFKEVSAIDFLRDIGKHFTVNYMMAKESVSSRLEDREQGISYTEFSYMLLQAYDYYFLNQEYGCNLQVGGTDQWGNITAGTEYVRRKTAADGQEQPETYGLTWPLITKADGSKFGKTESGTIWLSAERTSPYDFYQYFLRTPDSDVIQLLLNFSDLPVDQILRLGESLKAHPEKREAQKALASELTLLVHGQAELDKAKQASESLFSDNLSSMPPEVIEEMVRNAPSTQKPKAALSAGLGILDLLVETGLVKSKGNARNEITGGGIYLNNQRVDDVNLKIGVGHLLLDRFVIIRRGKKTYHAVSFE